MFINVFNSTALKLNLSLLLVFLLTSCSALERNFNFDSNRYTKSSLGAAAGAAIGATAGTIIGSTSGDAGQGFLLGGGIGALSGAVIGTDMDRTEELAYSRNTINRQNNQNNRLNTIRGNSFDGAFNGNSQGSNFNGNYNNGLNSGSINTGTISSSSYTSGAINGSFDSSGRFIIPEQNRPSAGYSSGAVNRTYAAARQTQPSYIVESNIGNAPNLPSTVYSGASTTTQVYEDRAPVVTSAPIIKAPKAKPIRRARLKPRAYTAPVSSAPKVVANKTIPLAKTTPFIKTAKVKDIPLAKTFPIDKPITQVIPSASIANATQVSKAIPNAKVISSTTISQPAITSPVVSSTTKTVGKAVANCSDAEAEATRARTAATDTDKIFYYRRALRLCNTKPNFHIEIGKVYSSIGRKEEAELEFSKALEIDPNNSEAQDELTILMLDGVN